MLLDFQTHARWVAQHGSRWTRLTFFARISNDWWQSILEEGLTMARRRLLVGGAAAIVLMLGALRLTAIEQFGSQERDKSIPSWFQAVDADTRARVGQALTKALTDTDVDVRTEARKALEAIAEQPGGTIAVTRRCRGNCMVADTMSTRRWNAEIKEALQDNDLERTAELLGQAAIARVTPSGVDALVQVLGHEDGTLRQLAAARLDSVRAAQAVPAWIAVLEDRNEVLRERAVISLGTIGSPDAINALARTIVRDAAVGVRRQAVRSLFAIAFGDID
jgi:hypothetical protein